jgi:DNA-binding MarR family transcriptional regulator
VGELLPRIYFRFRSWGARVGGVAVTEHGVEVLRRVPEESPMRLGRLAGLLGLSKGAASLMVKKLVRAGLVDRRRNPENEREVQIRLTPRGVRFLRGNPVVDGRRLVDYLRRLSSAERARIVEALRALLPPEEGGAPGRGRWRG